MKRRQFITSMAVLFFGIVLKVKAKVISGGMPWLAFAVKPPEPVKAGDWTFLTQQEASTLEALAECIIPTDETTIGGKEAGCAIFIDRQLSGDYGKATTVYRLGKIVEGTPQQGPQFHDTPAERYRLGLAAINSAAKQHYDGKLFEQLSEDQQNTLLNKIESGEVQLSGLNGQLFFSMLIQNVREGFFSDPLYGGNKGMASWKMLGFPGARYDFRDVIHRRGENLNIEPVSMLTDDRKS